MLMGQLRVMTNSVIADLVLAWRGAEIRKGSVWMGLEAHGDMELLLCYVSQAPFCHLILRYVRL